MSNTLDLSSLSREQALELAAGLAQILGTRKSSPRKGTFRQDQVLSVLVPNNPKKPGCKAYDVFALYRDGMTIEEARNLGIPAENLLWDHRHGFIRITDKTADKPIAEICPRVGTAPRHWWGPDYTTMNSVGRDAAEVPSEVWPEFIEPKKARKTRKAKATTGWPAAALAWAEHIPAGTGMTWLQ